MTRDDTVTVNHSEFDSFKSDVREWFQKMEGKIDELIHPEKGIHARMAKIESRQAAVEKTLDTYRMVVWRILTPILGALGVGLAYLMVAGMPK